MLHNRIQDADIDRLIFTRGYERLLTVLGSLTSTDTGAQRVLNGLINMELRLRTQALDDIIKDLQSLNPQWAADDLYVVLDTSVYIEHDDKLEKLDIAPDLTPFPDKRLHLLVPMVVIDELDGIKNKGEELKRWRAAYAIGVLERIFSPDQRAGCCARGNMASVALSTWRSCMTRRVIFGCRSMMTRSLTGRWRPSRWPGKLSRW
jgi:PIN domain